MHRQKHLDAFNELIVRLRLIERDMLKTSHFKKLPCVFKQLEQIKRTEHVYISTIKELIRRGKQYLSLNPETNNTIRVAIDMDKYISILEKLSMTK